MALLLTLTAFPPREEPISNWSDGNYDTAIKAFLHELQKVPTKTLAANSLDTEQSLLNILDPSINSIPFLLALNSHLPTGKPLRPVAVKDVVPGFHVGEHLLDKAGLFFQKFDPVQVRYLGLEWRTLLEYVYRVTKLSNKVGFSEIRSSRYLQSSDSNIVQPEVGIALLRTAILRLDPSAATLTSTHLLLVRECLEHQCYYEALPVIENIVTALPLLPQPLAEGPYLGSNHRTSSGFINISSGFSDKVNISDVQEYLLLSAMIYINIKMWKPALLYLELVLTTPNEGVASSLMVEAYRKFLVVGCLAEGKAVNVSRVNSAALGKLRALSRPYEALANIFPSHNVQRLQAEINLGFNQQIWPTDGNFGLVLQLIPGTKRFFLASLASTYSAIPLLKVSSWLDIADPNEAYAFIESLIAAKQLPARIDGDMLRFYNENDSWRSEDEKEAHQRLAMQTQRTQKLGDMVRAANEQVTLSRDYIEVLKRKRQSAKDGAGGPDADLDMMNHGDTMMQDEDLMEG